MTTNLSHGVKNRRYFVHPLIDFFAAGGLSLVTFLVFRGLGKDAFADEAQRASVIFMWFINWPHFSATVHRLYSSPQHRNRFPMTSYAIPAVVLVGVLASYLAPERVAPFFIKLFLIWSPYHFSGQTVGVTLVYAWRCGIKFSELGKSGLWNLVFGSYVYSTLVAESSLSGATYYGISYPGLGLPYETRWIGIAMMGIGASLFVFDFVRKTAASVRVKNWILFVPPMAQIVWFVLGADVRGFQVFVPMFHSLQYLLLAWAVSLSVRREQVNVDSKFVARETLRWWSLNLVGGYLLFYGFPYAISLLGLPLTFAMGIFIAGVQMHHFFVDGVIWRLRQSTNVSPLLSFIDDFISTPAEQRKAA